MLKPLHNRLVVERLEAEQTTASGIIIPDTAKEKPQQGRVISVGPGLRDKAGKLVPMEIEAGDTVIFAKYGGTDVTLDGKDYLILKEDDVLGVISGKAAPKAAPKSAKKK
jgi:chaperonin GroES